MQAKPRVRVKKGQIRADDLFWGGKVLFGDFIFHVEALVFSAPGHSSRSEESP